MLLSCTSYIDSHEYLILNFSLSNKYYLLPKMTYNLFGTLILLQVTMKLKQNDFAQKSLA